MVTPAGFASLVEPPWVFLIFSISASDAFGYPRTLDQAFGPHTSHIITEPQERTDWDGVVIVLGCIAAVAIVYAWLWGGA